MTRVNNPRFPHKVRIARATYSGPFDEDAAPVEIYKGHCRSYSKLSTSAEGEVISSVRMCAVPMSTFDWTDSTLPQTGDSVEITKGVQTEYGTVVDVQPNNFGTNIIWEYVRN